MAQDTWNPSQYEKFKSERAKPFFDLIGLIEKGPTLRVVDLGCGTGELTRTLHRELKAKETLGVDSSEAMLAKTKGFGDPGLRFEKQSIEDFVAAKGGKYDVVFSNAALQWLPTHEMLLSGLAALLSENGQLAVQVPANHDHVSHTVAAEVAAESPYREILGGFFRPLSVLKPEVYATVLYHLGFRQQRVELRVYGHELESREGVVEWVKGTLLTDYERRMPPEVFAQFVEDYRRRLESQLADEKPYFYPFKRVLLWAKK